jgi:hypothetical protein
VSYFTLGTIIIFMETIKDLYQTPTAIRPQPSSKSVQRFWRPSRPLPRLTHQRPRPTGSPRTGPTHRSTNSSTVTHRYRGLLATPTALAPPAGGGRGYAPDPASKNKNKYLKRKRYFLFSFFSFSFRNERHVLFPGLPPSCCHDAREELRDLQDAAKAIGQQLLVVPAASGHDFEAAFASILEHRAR